MARQKAAWTSLVGSTVVASLLTWPSSPATAAATVQNLGIASIPLFLGKVVTPNVMLTVDDSKSMGYAFMPNSIVDDYQTEGGVGTRRGLAAEWNWLAYDPSVIYVIPEYPVPEEDSAKGMPPSGKAWVDGYSESTDTVDLVGAKYVPDWKDDVTYADPESKDTLGAYYYTFDSGVSGCVSAGVPDYSKDSCYTRVEVVDSGEEDNFAVWYSFYRKRIFVAKAAALGVVTNLSARARYGLGIVSEGNTVVAPVRKMDDTSGPELAQKILGLTPTGDLSPLPQAIDNVGAYFADGTLEAWADDPGAADPNSSGGPIACRRAYNVLLSDGYWNEALEPAIGNIDGGLGTPFRDGWANTLADVATKWYLTDLVPGLSPDLSVTTKDPNPQQHLVTIAVGLGLEWDQTVSPEEAFGAIYNPPALPWPWLDPAALDPVARLDDFLHAAVNSRGAFLNMIRPQDLVDQMSAILKDVSDEEGSAASVVLNSGALRSDTLLYQARFSAADWSGQLLAYEIGDTGVVKLPYVWDAGKQIPAPDSRVIVTYDLTSRAPKTFRWTGAGTELTADQQVVLGGATDGQYVVNYVRGTKTPGTDLRPRDNTVLGDIINSAPAYVGPPSAGYPASWCDLVVSDPTSQKCANVAEDQGQSYRDFRFTKKADGGQLDRLPVIYVGANDGMLHAFNANYLALDDNGSLTIDPNGGRELFAYIPGVVLRNLKSGLVMPADAAAHTYFVDGSPTVVDAFFYADQNNPKQSSCTKCDDKWHTVLVAGLNGGGQGIYALDVTDPEGVTSEDILKQKVLWEFTDSDADCSRWNAGDTGDCDLGYTYSRPNIVRLNNGRWVAVFGNGYNNTFDDTAAGGTKSPTGQAALYIVDIETGKLFAKIGTSYGYTKDPATTCSGGTGNCRPNGLSSVAVVDADGNYTADYAYAGDLFGNLWKFDLCSDEKTCKFAIAGPPNDASGPIFTAKAGQAITVRPQVSNHPDGGGFIVTFGTGKFFENADAQDVGSQPIQSVYGIWDSYVNAPAPNVKAGQYSHDKKIFLSDLVQRKILLETDAGGNTYRLTTGDEGMDKIVWKAIGASGTGTHLGWYMDLLQGERQVSDAVVRGETLIFTTFIPYGGCEFGGEGWLMELDAATGGRPSYPPFDINGDGVFTVSSFAEGGDLLKQGSVVVPPSGRKSNVGIIPTPAILATPRGEKEYKYMSGSSGGIERVVENPGPGSLDFARNSWEQLFR